MFLREGLKKEQSKEWIWHYLSLEFPSLTNSEESSI